MKLGRKEKAAVGVAAGAVVIVADTAAVDEVVAVEVATGVAAVVAIAAIAAVTADVTARFFLG